MSSKGVVYQISVSGFLEPSWSGRLSGMRIVHNKNDLKTITTLTGELKDQSALNGVLNTLFDQRYPVISVLKLSD